ncbi:MATE family efflux transporter [Treponema pectinovorum]|uniref:MATE family efflux transporter n=1 Tax=Treponema pectinovorum TaxID=164 RepID=UPI0011CB092C|nr:MATE family efflux transporter [Treponema pectinovorum]
MKDMTTGPVTKHLVTYAIPMILGNFFQLTYNAVDSIILGHFSGKHSLAAVGIANPVMNIMIFFIVGICLGAGILMSEFYGAKDEQKLKKEISTTIVIGFSFTLFVSILCYIFVEHILMAIRTPQDLIETTSHYLRIVFLGLVFTFFYNVFAAALRAVGDSKTPIICVGISAILNGILDYVFVAVLNMQIKGAAYATVLSQAVSCALVLTSIYLKEPMLAIRRGEFIFDKKLVKSTLNYSWATALQQIVLYVGKLLIQSAVNPLGTDAIATFNAGSKIDDFCYQPAQSIGHTITTFMAQNRGAHQKERMLKGFKKGMLIEWMYGLFIGIFVFLMREPLITLFATKNEVSVISLGKEYLLVMSLLYILPATTNGIQGFFRGLGIMKVTVIATTSQIVFRVAFSYILASIFASKFETSRGIIGIALACLAGWTAMLLYELPALKIYGKKFKEQKFSE